MDNASYLTDQPFTDLDLAPELIRGLETAGFSHCTQIQQQALPLALAGKDVAGQAQTGTGKSAAFLLAIFNRLLRQSPHTEHGTKSIRAVVLAPTRELAIQIHRDATQLCKYTALRMGLVYGGTGYQDQTEALGHGVDILIGTPGRFIDFYKQGLFDLKAVQVLVLDEADRMFDLGFIRDIRYVLRRMPPPDERLNMLFSATMSRRVEELAYEHMNDPISIKIASETPVADQLIEEVYYPANEEKLGLLVGLLKKLAGERVLIFCNMRGTTEKIGRLLERQKYSVGVLSGDVPQKKRERLLGEFTLGRLQMLVATDVAARGLHIPSVSHVFNFDLPQDPEDYVHRIGRTARAGASGHAISFACEDHAFSLIDIESFIGHALNKQEILPQDIAPLKTPHQDKVGKPRRKIEPPISNRTPDASTRGSARRQSANVVKTSVSDNASVGETSPLATNESRTVAEAAPSTAPYAPTKPSGKPPFPGRRASEVPAVG
ncbi:MAG: DEAD/DEAH box helicase [Arenicellales bacterium]|nr:DEAD/DEAH box helicase [Arenicellales bacterium]